MRPMDATMIDEHLDNIDRRLTKLEQFLPTLATKEELRTLATKEELHSAIADAVAPLATKEELRAAVAPLATKEELRAAVAPLATKEELRAAVAPLATKEEFRAAIALLATKDDLGELRRHMNVLHESLRGDIHLIAAHVASERSKDTGS